jgi:hypothetical protein
MSPLMPLAQSRYAIFIKRKPGFNATNVKSPPHCEPILQPKLAKYEVRIMKYEVRIMKYEGSGMNYEGTSAGGHRQLAAICSRRSILLLLLHTSFFILHTFDHTCWR